VTIATESSWPEDFEALLPQIERVIQFVGHRHRLSPQDLDDFGSEVKIKLIENDYAILRKFEHRSSLGTFLTTVVSNAFHDYRYRQWGKWRPSADARRLGAEAILLEQLLVRDCLSFEEALQAMVANHGVSLSKSELERIASRLPVRYRRHFESDEALVSMPASDRPDVSLLKQERQSLWERVLAILHEVQQELDSTDALILAMRFQDGKKVSEIAQTLTLNARPLYERVHKLLERLRRALEARGIDASFVRELFDDND
jgi:RNA polymerase sigma factor (sigma-70 family)